jgi:hypothetical protein
MRNKNVSKSRISAKAKEVHTELVQVLVSDPIAYSTATEYRGARKIANGLLLKLLGDEQNSFARLDILSTTLYSNIKT